MSNSLLEFSNELADAVERAGSSVIAVLEGGREGVSGTLWRDGLAITAEHTIRGLDEVTVLLPSGSKAKARVAGRDHGTDIAILQVPAGLTSAAIADESQTRVGEVILAVGRREAEGIAATYGIVSAIGGPWRTWQGARVDRWLRLDLNPFTGFSGGPIVNAARRSPRHGHLRRAPLRRPDPRLHGEPGRRSASPARPHRPRLSRHRHAAGCLS